MTMRNIPETSVKFKVITLDEFLLMKLNWNNLLHNSDANTLFLTWEWLSHWWAVWGEKLDLKLNVIACYSAEQRLIGLAPLYKSKGKIFNIFSSVRLGVIGSSYKKSTTVRSEFQDFIVDKADPIRIRKLLIDEIFRDKSWDEFILTDLLTTSSTFALFTINKEDKWPIYIRTILKDIGVSINTTLNFKEYLQTISKNIRYSAFNKSSILKSNYDISEGEVSNNNEFSKNIATLNNFHKKRWGKVCFDKEAEKFHSLMFKETGKFHSYFLSVDDGKEPISLSYNINYQGKCHNIQLGFDSSFDKKFALGSLNLGELIKRSFLREGIDECDMLLGSGQNTFYKERFNGRLYKVTTFQIIRNPIIRLIYFSYDNFKRYIK
jgi:hypothetical protein